MTRFNITVIITNMYDLPENTLYHFLQNPILSNVKLDSISLAEFSKMIKSFIKQEPHKEKPAVDCLKFYLANHAFHLLKNKYRLDETLPPDALELARQHYKITTKISQRILYYTIIAGDSELTFIPRQKKSFYEYIEANFGANFAHYLEKNNHNYGGGCGWRNDYDFKRKLRFEDFDKNISFYDFLSALNVVFFQGKWEYGAGGPSWGLIMRTVKDVFDGQISFELMADYAFHMCHDRGSMFDRGFFYDFKLNGWFDGGTDYGFGNKDDPIYRILDVQASGQIPQLVNELINKQKSNLVDQELKELYSTIKKIFPEIFEKKVEEKLIKDKSDHRQQQLKAQQARVKNYQTKQVENEKEDDYIPTPKQAINTLLLQDYHKRNWIKPK